MKARDIRNLLLVTEVQTILSDGLKKEWALCGEN